MGRATELRRTAVFAVTAVMAGFGLTGVASAQSLTNMNGWGGTSTTTVQNKCSITNVNDVSASNSNSQVATSGDAVVTGNGSSYSWSGWDQLSPENAQGQGMSYSAWYNGVVNWASNRADGAGWMSNGDGNALPPSGGGWDSYDPMLWQSSNLKFGDWYNSVQHYLNQNSPTWLLGWPASDTGSGAGSATTGNATNNNSADFSININNAASAKYSSTPACGHSAATASCPCGNSGKGGGVVAGNAGNLTQQTSQNKPTGNGGGQGGYTPGQSGYGSSESGYTPTYSKGSAPSGQENPSTESSESTSQTGSTGGGSTYCPPASTPETTAGSVAARTTVTNTNVVSVSNVSTQTAVTGNAVVANNGPSGMGGSGNATNGNGTGLNADLND